MELNLLRTVNANLSTNMAKKLGRAHAMQGQLWKLWVKYSKTHAEKKYFIIVFLIEALCVRVSQVCRLKAEHVDLRKKRVWLDQFKKHKAIWKPMLPSTVAAITEWKKNEKGSGFKWPKTGLLFPASGRGKGKSITKDIVARHIRKHRAKFVENFKDKYPDLLNGQAIRSHSGRRHSISKFAGAGVSEAFGMAWSQIESRTVYQSYVDLQPEMVYPTIAKFDRKLQRVR